MKNFILDGLMISLLITAIIFCYRLNSRLQKLRAMGEDLSPFMKNLSIYLGNISSAIDKLKQVAEIGQKGLNENIPAAAALKDDFDVLLEHSEKVAKRLDEVIEKAREMDRQLHRSIQILSKTQKNEDLYLNNLEPNEISRERSNYRSHDSYPSSIKINSNENYRQGEPYFSKPAKDFDNDEKLFSSHSSINLNDVYVPNEILESNKYENVNTGILSKLKGLR